MIGSTDEELDNAATPATNGLSLPSSPAYTELAGMLRRKILSGEIPLGERLPTELSITTELGISRSTVREAFRVLQAWGYLRRISPRIMVASKPVSEAVQRETRIALMEQHATHDDIFQTTYLLAPALAALAAERATDQDLALLRSIVNDQEKYLSDITQTGRLMEWFLVSFIAAARNPAMAIVRASLHNLRMPTANSPAEVTRVTAWALDSHKKILAAFEARDSEMAKLLTQRHMKGYRALWEAAGLDYNSPISNFFEPE